MSKTDKLEQKKEDSKDFLAGKDKSGPYEGLTTRQIVLQKSLELFSMQGFAAVSMRNIADAAGIRASSIYHHFKGKQELFDALVEQVNGRITSYNVCYTKLLRGKKIQPGYDCRRS